MIKLFVVFLFLLGVVTAQVLSGAKAGDFDNWVFATEWQNQWIQGDCSDTLLVDNFKSTSYGASHLSLHGMWPNYNHSKRGYDYPAYCVDGSDDYRKCQGRDQPSFCYPSASTLKNYNVTNRWMKYATEYSWSDLASHEWPKHGGCTGWTQDKFFNLDEQMYNWLANGNGFKFVTANTGKSVSYKDLSAAFAKDTGGKRSVFQCSSCHLSEFWMGWQADPNTLMPSYPISLASSDRDTCESCSSVKIAGYADYCDNPDSYCVNGARGPACDYSSSAGTSDDPCLQYSGCLRCPHSTHDGVHYCTSQSA